MLQKEYCISHLSQICDAMLPTHFCFRTVIFIIRPGYKPVTVMADIDGLTWTD